MQMLFLLSKDLSLETPDHQNIDLNTYTIYIYIFFFFTKQNKLNEQKGLCKSRIHELHFSFISQNISLISLTLEQKVIKLTDKVNNI